MEPLISRIDTLGAATEFCSVCGADLDRTSGDMATCVACGHHIWFDWQSEGRSIVVRLGGLGIVTEQNMMRTLARLDREVEAQRCSEVRIDFGSMTHLTSTAVAQLVLLKRRIDAVGGSTTIEVRREELLDVFRITRLDSILRIESHVERPRRSENRR
ncbi:MAG: hypothetical protein SFX72_08565 [Isosphaeraceae bacterium]|nr:hypothetical protein [Isosphaeraceae bacterium]